MQEEGIIRSPDTLRDDRIPPGQVLSCDWPVLHYGKMPRINISEWNFRLFGLVDREINLKFHEFAALPTVKVWSDIHCVTTWSHLNNLWEGPSSKVVTGMVKLNPRARYVIVHGAEGFTTNLTLEDFLQDDVLFAMKHDDKSISEEHGAPVRLVVPRLYFWKSAKWVTGLEFTADDRPGFWEKAGYHNHGDPWKEERRI
jgi:DMSO/TMAO reductase YedYZ molybdopterin-dependent catalytic subunit